LLKEIICCALSPLKTISSEGTCMRLWPPGSSRLLKNVCKKADLAVRL
jgi:hypothetical protein